MQPEQEHDHPAPVSTATSPLGVPDSLTVRSEAAAAVGAALLAGGMASFRVKAAMAVVARALGLDSFRAIVTFTDITATATLGGRYRTRITQPEHVGVDVDHLARIHRMVEDLPERVEAAEVFERLAVIAARPPLHSAVVNALAAGLACAAFSFLNRGGPTEMVCVLIAATLGQALRRALQRRQWNHLLITVLAATLTSIVYALTIAAGTRWGVVGPGHEGGYLAAMLFLVPGFPMITGILDIVRSDFSAGVARLTYSAMIVLAAAASVWTVSVVVGITPGMPPGAEVPFVLDLVLRALATFVGVLGFAVIFNSPWGIALGAAAVSMVANTLRLAMIDSGAPAQLATLVATCLVGALAYLVARLTHIPRTTISVPAVVIMIPGFTLSMAFALMNSGDVTGALVLAQEAVQVILAAGLGLALAHLATSPAWRRVTQPH
ncbi:threonine/serine exporter family protein [Brachybacterium sp. EF45031]|uniref:threonine/serine ThrE exporter family protein n=1 Tax=Brachybacterium sillae TaxID=2810536 RepID=UPI00217CD710|nr:threonine/serine exporter family protein [Brachybacterium sillae]MCS6711432.1 threonine/serine exporter family protein [Brachybacterium sillae]